MSIIPPDDPNEWPPPVDDPDTEPDEDWAKDPAEDDNGP